MLKVLEWHIAFARWNTTRARSINTEVYWFVGIDMSHVLSKMIRRHSEATVEPNTVLNIWTLHGCYFINDLSPRPEERPPSQLITHSNLILTVQMKRWCSLQSLPIGKDEQWKVQSGVILLSFLHGEARRNKTKMWKWLRHRWCSL